PKELRSPDPGKKSRQSTLVSFHVRSLDSCCLSMCEGICMDVPFLDLKSQHPALEGELTDAFGRTLRGAAFVGGPEVEAFETEFAQFCKVGGSVGVGSGTDALRFAYSAMGVSPGDEVITVPNTFIATTEALTQVGAAIRFVDVQTDTLLMDPNQVASAVGP